MTPQQQAQQWLRENCLILDTETTGLGEDAEIVEVTIIDTDGQVLLNTLVKPRSVIPASATAIHGITNEMVANAPSWPHVCRSLYGIISGRKVVIYNSDFDTRILDQTNDAWGITIHFKIERPTFECAMLAYAEFYGQNSERGGYKWQKLTAAAEQQGVIIEGTPHRALSDCLTTLGVIKAMAAGGVRRASHGITAQKAVDILNGLFQVDPDAITALVDNRVKCSEYFAKKTAATVGICDSTYIIGMIGVINALIAPEVIAGIYDGNELKGFAVADVVFAGGDA
ncbi:3'-5' exonuclease [Serratia marcescens]|uniref:3'-5' exonuclease n=1 Tax=Serratia marcescens TaxID=615 RepID=UPI0015D84544|nr:3'-5' exonuclease [Serratia marcescens]MBH2978504.1 3'-5' exonuclease [Serratia marcescens]MBN5325896.1 3'-5' exonuclease [Serratia marcescens]MBN5347608.1 3'-5' exonuclease [Serratia marcescens]QLJ60088.1 3'-5' exonuclease [Serratia marcescens]